MLGDQVRLVDGLGEAAGAGPRPLEEVGDAGAQRVGVLVGGLGGAGQGPGVGDGHARASSGTSAGPAGVVAAAARWHRRQSGMVGAGGVQVGGAQPAPHAAFQHHGQVRDQP